MGICIISRFYRLRRVMSVHDGQGVYPQRRRSHLAPILLLSWAAANFSRVSQPRMHQGYPPSFCKPQHHSPCPAPKPPQLNPEWEQQTLLP